MHLPYYVLHAPVVYALLRLPCMRCIICTYILCAVCAYIECAACAYIVHVPYMRLSFIRCARTCMHCDCRVRAICACLVCAVGCAPTLYALFAPTLNVMFCVCPTRPMQERFSAALDYFRQEQQATATAAATAVGRMVSYGGE